MKSNPNGANQYVLDPRQKLCWDYYINPESETFSNITQSGIKAGFTEAYSDEIGQTGWFRAKLWRLNSVGKSEKVFDEIFETSHTDLETGKVDTGILKIKADIAKFLASTQGKSDGYSTKIETENINKDVPGGSESDVDLEELAELMEEKLREIKT